MIKNQELPQGKKQDAKFNYMKIVLALMVVAIHAELYPQLLYPWLRLAVPLFFCMASYFLFLKVGQAQPEQQWGILKQFLWRNAALYGFWFVVWLPVTLYIKRNEYFAGGPIRGLLMFLRSLLFGGTFVASWYLMASIIAVPLVFWLCKRLGMKGTAAICAVMFCLVTLQSSYLALFDENGVFYRAVIAYERMFNNPVMSFPGALTWVFVGKCFADGKLRISIPRWAHILVILLLGAALYGEWSFVSGVSGVYSEDSYFFLLPLCIAIFAFVVRQKPIYTQNPLAFHLKGLSTVIYAAHGSLLSLIGFLYRKGFHSQSDLLVALTAIAACVVIYAVIAAVLRRKPGSRLAGVLRYAC